MPGIKLESLATTEADTQGVWMDAGDFDEEWRGAFFKIARAGNPEYTTHVQEQMTRLLQTHKRGSKGWRKAFDRMTRVAAAKHILKDWRGLLDPGGNEIPYSEELALKFCIDPKWYRIWNLVQESSGNDEEFRRQQRDDALGNSVASSDGNSTSEETSPSPSSSPEEGS